DRSLALLGAAGRTFQASNPEARMAVTSVKEFAEDFIRALGEGVAGAWRERWWTVDLLLVHGVEALSETERAQDEFFHLFEALKRRGARVMLVADRGPSGITKIDERLRSRFEGGLVLEVDAGAAAGPLELVLEMPAKPKVGLWDAQATAGGERVVPPLDEFETGDRAGLFIEPGEEAPPAPTPKKAVSLPPPAGPPPGPVPSRAKAPQEPKKGGAWFPSAENVVIHWPKIEELLQEELD
ncbi:MAG TPA: DnaA/Hda family protein, partial [Longimicrobiales bacterium]|nr:DnaA/Hda family protein [Longimicrobiales bacterium]